MDYRALLLLAVYIPVAAELGIAQAAVVSPNLKTAELGIAQTSAVSQNLTTAESGFVQASTLRVLIEETNESALSPSGPDPTHDNFNVSNTNLANSTLYNSYGAPNPSGADPYHDYINRSDTKGANSGNPLRQLELVLYTWLILLHICIWYFFG